MILKKTIFLLFLFISNNVFASDTLYVPFLNKVIIFQDGYSFTTVRNNKTLYLFNKAKGDSSISCFVFRKNRLVISGNLILVRKGNIVEALRESYWSFFNSKKSPINKYYHWDELLEENNTIPIENIFFDFK